MIALQNTFFKGNSDQELSLFPDGISNEKLKFQPDPTGSDQSQQVQKG